MVKRAAARGRVSLSDGALVSLVGQGKGDAEPAAGNIEFLDQPAGVWDVVEAEVGRILFDRGIIKSADPPRAISVALGTAHDVTLVVTEGGNGRDCDHANWAEPVLVATTETARPPGL